MNNLEGRKLTLSVSLERVLALERRRDNDHFV